MIRKDQGGRRMRRMVRKRGREIEVFPEEGTPEEEGLEEGREDIIVNL